MNYYSIALLVALGLGTAASAQPPAGNDFGPPPSPPGGFGGGPGGPGAAAPSAIFAALDADGDGVISSRELRKAVATLKQLDIDKDGQITESEASGRPTSPTEIIERALANDKNGDGKLSKSELPRPLAQMLDTADANGDGALDRAELTTALQTARGGWGGGPRGGMGNAAGYSNDPRPAANGLMTYDANGNGKIDASEVPTQMRGMMRGADQDGDGALSASEVQAIQQRMTERLRGQRPMPPGMGVGPQGVTNGGQPR